MANAQAGAYVRAADIVDTIEADMAEDTSVGSAAANFTLISATVRTALGGQLIDFTLYISNDNAITATNSNFSDVTCFTLENPYRPGEVKNAAFGNGAIVGEATLTVLGSVQLRCASDSIAAGSNIRVNFTYLKA